VSSALFAPVGVGEVVVGETFHGVVVPVTRVPKPRGFLFEG
jgi:hypothetical protein